MSNQDGDDGTIAQDPSPVVEGPESKKLRTDEDDSSEDDDYYSNFDKMLERNNKATQKLLPKYVPAEKKEASPRLISSSDSESDIEEVKEENTLAVLMRKGKKYNEDREKKINAEMEKIKQLAQVREAEQGAQPDLMYRDPHAKEAESRLRRLKEDRQAAHRRSLDTNYVDCVVIDNYGQRTEKEYGSTVGNTQIRRKAPEVTFLLQDLHKNDTKIEKIDHDAQMRSLVQRIIKRWGCNEVEVVLTLEGGIPVTDIDQSPKELNVSLDGIHTVSAVYVPSKKAVHQESAPRDPNSISIKFQSGEGRKPFVMEMNKSSPFSEILSNVAAGLKMDSVGKMMFDCEKVDFSSTPLDLDMDDDDCMDVYTS